MVVPCMVNSSLKRSAPTRVLSGRASCRRMISASMPPTRKKMNAEVPYRIPIRLWSTVVSQDQTVPQKVSVSAFEPCMKAACVAMRSPYFRLSR